MQYRVVLILICFGLAGAARSATWYVSATGGNANPGTEVLPWATPGYGSKQMSGGDTLMILGGTYILSEFWEDMITPPSGMQDRPTVIQGEFGNRPVLKGRNNLFSAIELSDKSNICIDNLEITSDNGAYFREGVSASGQCENILLSGLSIHHMDEFGINFQDVMYLGIIDCDIQYCGFGAIGGPEGEAGGWQLVEIGHCNLSYSGHYYQGQTGPGMGPYDRPDGLGLEPSDGELIIDECIIEHNRGDGLDSKVQYTSILNCIVANNDCDGIKLWGTGSEVVNTLIYGTGDGDPTDSPWAALVIDNVEDPGATFSIVNTTIHQDPRKHGYILYSQYDSDTPVTINMTNTLIAGGSGAAFFGPSVTLQMDHCLVHREGESVQVVANGQGYTAADIEAGQLGPGCRSADPLFVSPAWGSDGDYRLQAASPAVDAGVMNGSVPEQDLNGNPRPGGPAPDMGCYEYPYPVRVERNAETAGPSPLAFHPSRNQVEVRTDRPGTLTLYNVLGQTLFSRQVHGQTFIPVRSASGIVIAVLEEPGIRTVSRFCVIR